MPTPVAVDGMLAFCSERNGTRLTASAPMAHRPEPARAAPRLAPDTTTPVAAAGRLFGNWEGMYCLDLAAGCGRRGPPPIAPMTTTPA